MTPDVTPALANLQWTVDHHFLHIQNHSPFARAIAVQFELAYTDMRIVELALQLRDPVPVDLLSAFRTTYAAIRNYEWPFIAGGPEEYYAQHGADFSDYQQQVTEFDALIAQISALATN
ncbi:hypothetical protein [Lacticaseibacillus daqingensis]|uniref:hypothetical protein n=1 Tax=Lacticaseibacillus daqingensis TaxID=2486014 RepID=UPI000F768DB5|nr:hypothetical protein [Lacticaseibacillus daqingensis]